MAESIKALRWTKRALCWLMKNKTGTSDIADWHGAGGVAYKVSAADGTLTSNTPGRSIYQSIYFSKEAS